MPQVYPSGQRILWLFAEDAGESEEIFPGRHVVISAWGKAHVRALFGVTHSSRSVVVEASLGEWMETLPFPLASILWRAEAVRRKPGQAGAHLLDFFEALAQYWPCPKMMDSPDEKIVFSRRRFTCG